ncbi:hypothetical protein D3C86_1986600 [compost metagenome]
MGDALALAQAAALEAVAQRHEALADMIEATFLADAGHQHRRLEQQLPAAVGGLLQLPFGAAADRHLLPVGGVLGGEGFQSQGAGGQAEQGEGKR